MDKEKDLEYIKSIIYGKLVDRTIDEDYSELAPLVFGRPYSSDVARRMFYGARKVLEVLENEQIKNVNNELTDEKLLSDIDDKIRELKLERNKVQAEKVELNKLYREKARVDLRFEKLEDAIKNLEPIQVPVPYLITDGRKEGILTISDTHFGRNTLIKGLEGEIINEYNEDIFQDRMWQILDNAIQIIKKENLDIIRLIFNGDLIDGMLRQSQISQLQYGVVDQTMKFAEFTATWINELSKYCYIEMYCALGNHDQVRVLNSKNGEFPEENMCKIVYWYIKARLENNLNVNINVNNNEHIFFNSLGLNIMASHGEEKNLEQAIKDYTLLYGKRIDLFITGHLHSGYTKTVGIGKYGMSDIEVIRVKSICGIDDYSTKLRKSSSAGTSLIIIEEDKGKTITYDIKLD